MGYVLFVILLVFGSGLAVALATPIFLLLGPCLGIATKTPEAARTASALFGGIVWGGAAFGFVALVLALFPTTSIPVLVGLGSGLMLLAAPKVNNARLAVPAGIASLVLLSVLL